MAEGGSCGLDIWRELGAIEWFLGGGIVLLGDDVIDGLFHLLLFFIPKNTTAHLYARLPKYQFLINTCKLRILLPPK